MSFEPHNSDLPSAKPGFTNSAQEQLTRVLSGMTEGFAVLDSGLQILDINAEGLRIDGRSRDQLVGKHVLEAWPESDRLPKFEAYQEALRTGQPSTFEYHHLSDRHDVWLEVRVYPLEDRLAVFYRDVTERHKATAALQASEEFNRKVLASSADCIKVLDLDARLEFLSEGGMCVMEVDDFELIRGAYWPDFWSGTDRERALSAVNAARLGQPGHFQGFATTAKGNPRWWDVAVTPINGADGKPEKILSISRDVTATHRAEAALDQASRRLDAILANTRMAVFLMDERQQCIYANPSAEQLTGYSLAEMQGRPLHDVVHHKRPDGSHYPLDECPIDRAFPERAHMQGEELFVAPDGSFYPVAFTASPVLDDGGRPIGTVIEARNIAEEKAAEADRRDAYERLQEETRTLETLNKVGQAVAAELELDRIVQLVTDASVELTGAQFGAFFYNVLNDAGESYMLYTLSGVERSAFENFPMPRATDVFQPTFQGDGVIRSDDILVDARYGKNDPHFGMPQGHLPVRSYLAVPVMTGGSEVIGGLFFGHSEPQRFTERHERLMTGLAAQAAIAVDKARLYQAAQREIEERRSAEERLRELNETLEHRVVAEVAERAKTEEALRQAQKMEAVGQLTGGIAHDFNNLLTVVTGNIDMANRALAAANFSDARATRALDNALKGAERAAALTQRLLAFSRRQPLAPKAIDVDKLVVGMSDLLNRALGEMVGLEIVTSPGLWRVEADPNQLESAILNLAVNARDAMPRGGQLTIETANARLDEQYAAQHAEVAPGQYVVIAVTDTGSGMPKDMIARVFEPFFTTKEVGKGTGLGLSMVYGFVKQSGGNVKVYSEEGQGTTVKLYLPRLSAEGAAEHETTLTQGMEVSRHRECILVVEDDDDVRAYTVECLRELGYRVLEAHDGPSALRLQDRQKEAIDLLFTDVVMPGMTGRELAEAAREQQPGLRVLYTSGYTRNAIVHGGRLEPGVDMIAKPFTYQGLAQKIRDVLDQGRTGRILVVDGEPNIRALVAEVLTAAGYVADEAATALEALNKVRSAQGLFDVLVVNHSLTDREGPWLIRELRALHADLPFVLAVGDDHHDQIERQFAKDRCVIVVSQPVTGAKLHAALDRLGIECPKASSAT
ncbi:PAS domain-containing protein [Sphingomonas sp. TZW2008]|uniref:PAS domain-containing protein n=1 Tax=Sphingomonas sp. TZW2008 TaxID=1917973 RepID=UPI000A270BA4|nr:PAS domain-containing protein [Sphingomonas sp. TZW2008]